MATIAIMDCALLTITRMLTIIAITYRFQNEPSHSSLTARISRRRLATGYAAAE